MIVPPEKSKDKEKGYILLEVLVTLLIISLVITSILSGFSVIGSIVGKSWERTQTIIIDRNEFDRLQRIPDQQ